MNVLLSTENVLRRQRFYVDIFYLFLVFIQLENIYSESMNTYYLYMYYIFIIRLEQNIFKSNEKYGKLFFDQLWMKLTLLSGVPRIFCLFHDLKNLFCYHCQKHESDECESSSFRISLYLSKRFYL